MSVLQCLRAFYGSLRVYSSVAIYVEVLSAQSLVDAIHDPSADMTREIVAKDWGCTSNLTIDLPVNLYLCCIVVV